MQLQLTRYAQAKYFKKIDQAADAIKSLMHNRFGSLETSLASIKTFLREFGETVNSVEMLYNPKIVMSVKWKGSAKCCRLKMRHWKLGWMT